MIEHSYVDDTGTSHHELNLLFAAEIAGAAVSQEEHLEFFWLPIDQITTTDLRPAAMNEAPR
ncbi:hypothetical protein [Nocardia sp. NPDC051570]|uniref:hypothetical protein n=1 Tax=Nocardia sp. NPDC051570 TaxID=3364324 RepID=UPI0037AFC1B4